MTSLVDAIVAEGLGMNLPKLSKAKPIVHYREQIHPVALGERAHIIADEHYRLGRLGIGEFLNTSMVVAISDDGNDFETLNTKYVKIVEDVVEAV